jgi:hypothetical protein
MALIGMGPKRGAKSKTLPLITRMGLIGKGQELRGKSPGFYCFRSTIFSRSEVRILLTWLRA